MKPNYTLGFLKKSATRAAGLQIVTPQRLEKRERTNDHIISNTTLASLRSLAV